jgi:predicted porin
VAVSWSALADLSEFCWENQILFALAVLTASGASFAQSSVTISGILDVAAYKIGGSGSTANTNATSLSSRVGTATSAINFSVVEDLGGGLKAQAFVALDPRDFAADGAGIARHETFIGVTGGFGQIRLGAVNSGSLGASGAGSVMGTATGSGYGLADLQAGGSIRYSRNVRYDTPRVSGFAASINYAPGNDDGTAAGALLVGGAVTPVGQQVTDFGLSYAAGPLNVTFSSLQRSATATAVKSTYNSIGANYTMGAARVFVTMGDGDKSSLASAAPTLGLLNSTAGSDTKLSRIGGQYTMGATTLMASTTSVEIGTAAKRTIMGLRADYALSKRTAAYVGYEGIDTGATSANKINTAMVGVRHSF